MSLALLRKLKDKINPSRESPFLAANTLVRSDGKYVHNAKAFSARMRDIYSPSVKMVVNCPCCEGTDFTALDYPPNFRAQEDIFLADERLSQKLSMCSRCGLILSRKILPPDFYFEYINSSYNNYHIPPEGKDPLTEKGYLDKHHFIKEFAWPHLPKLQDKPKLLEISSFVGSGLSSLADSWDVYGLEAENAAALFSVKQHPELQGRIINDVLENALLPGRELSSIAPFDVVLFMYSFRQMAHPVEVIRWLKDVVKPGGIVVIAEGVFSDYIFKESDAAAASHFYHNKACYYNRHNLSALMGRFGFGFVDSTFLGAVPERAFDQSAIVFRNDNVVPSSFDFDAALNLSKQIYAHFLPRASAKRSA